MTENLEPIATRMRLFGLIEEDARDQLAETVIGRLRIRNRRSGDKAGGLSEPQYQAAVEYRRLADAYKRALSAPDSLSNASRGGLGERSEAEAVSWAKAVIGKFEAARKAVMHKQCEIDNRGRNLIAALDYLVLRNEAHMHMIGDLRVGLNALVRHFGMT